MKNIVKGAAFALMVLCGAHASGTDFFSTAPADRLFSLGVRTGVNMSNTSVGGDAFTWNHNSWGTGFDGGIVADINFRDWLAIQPGFFYQSRSNSYTHITGYGVGQQIMLGHALYYSFNIPVLMSVRFNVADNLRWYVEVGPYIAFGLGHNDKGRVIADGEESPFDYGYFDRHKKFQWGFKMGTGLRFLDHYFVGIHYLAGVGNVWKLDGYNGHSKAWTFTVGYDF